MKAAIPMAVPASWLPAAAAIYASGANRIAAAPAPMAKPRTACEP